MQDLVVQVHLPHLRFHARPRVLLETLIIRLALRRPAHLPDPGVRNELG